ncbi:MAG: hypothetical protein HY074_05180 [Deltaproteobacteria bacterium]|nr:hypothetical protein [Deltaproteobacteria bacterium]
MKNYRTLIHAVMQRSGISLDQSLSSIALVIRAVVWQLSSEEAAILKLSLAPELGQLVVEARRGVAAESRPYVHADAGRNGLEIIESVGAALDLPELEAQARICSVLDELRAEVSLWEDVKVLEIIDGMRAVVSQALPRAAVA